MNWKKLFFALSLCLTLGVLATSCDQEVDSTLERRAREEGAFLAFKDSADYKQVSLPGLYGDGYVYIKWIERGNSEQRAKATDRVLMHYDGYFLTNWVGGQRSGLFDSNFDQEVITPFAVDNLILGKRIALQNMVEGDEVLVVIPWYLAYGSNGKRRIPPYTSLLFRVKLKQIQKA